MVELVAENGPNAELEEFIESSIWPNVTSSIVLDAFRQVDRGKFLRGPLRRLSYRNFAVQIKDGVSNSEPGLVGKMIDQLDPNGHGKVLEIGTGTGHVAALLSCCYEEVHTIEIDPELANSATNRLKHLGFNNVSVHIGDGLKGLEGNAPFDSILVTGAVRIAPKKLLDQLAVGGRIVVPVGKDPQHSEIIVALKSSSNFMVKPVIPVQFHPIMSSEPGGFSEENLRRVEAVKRALLNKMAEEQGLSFDVFIQRVAELNNIPSPWGERVIIQASIFPEELYED